MDSVLAKQSAGLAVLWLGLIMAAWTQAGELVNRSEPLPGITSSGQPDEAALRAIAEEGYVAVIDIRGLEENRGIDEQAAVESLDLRYVSLPIAGPNDMTYENANVLDKILAELDGPVLIHCASGNRVGGLLALRERLKGASTEEALAIGRDAGMSSPALQSVIQERLSEPN